MGRRPEDITIIEGTIDLTTGGRQIAASEIIMHGKYRKVGNVAHNDMALVRLRSPAQSVAHILLGRTHSDTVAVLPQNIRVEDIAARGMDMGNIPDLQGRRPGIAHLRARVSGVRRGELVEHPHVP